MSIIFFGTFQMPSKSTNNLKWYTFNNTKISKQSKQQANKQQTNKQTHEQINKVTCELTRTKINCNCFFYTISSFFSLEKIYPGNARHFSKVGHLVRLFNCTCCWIQFERVHACYCMCSIVSFLYRSRAICLFTYSLVYLLVYQFGCLVVIVCLLAYLLSYSLWLVFLKAFAILFCLSSNLLLGSS